MTGTPVSPLVTLRLGSSGSPSLRDVAKKMRVSATAISSFELGKAPLSDELIARYAKAIGSSSSEVRERFLRSALAYHHGRVKEIRELMTRKKHRKTRPGRPLALQ